MKIKIIILIAIFGGIIIGVFIQNPLKATALRQDVLGTSDNCPYKLINQRRCEPDVIQKKEFVTARNDLLAYIVEQKKYKKVTHVSVYFRDLQNGPTLSIDSQESFAPASLLKVPLMITYYKKAETKPSVLEQKIVVPEDVQIVKQVLTPEMTPEPGREYTVDELITLMITQSDNTSWKLLLDNLRTYYSEEDFVITLSDLGIIDPRKRNDQQYITVQSYAAIFRILYNSSYLNPEISDKALSMLTNSAFDEGIEAGVKNGTIVANKFGEQLNGKEQQLHDCGIIYYPPNPYLLCVMTKGNSLSEQKSIIKDISKRIYKEVSENI